MKKNTIGTLGVAALALGALLSAPGVQARELTADEALSRAIEVVGSPAASVTGTGPLRGIAAERVQCVYTGTVPGSAAPAFYVFDREGGTGFIIAGADTRLQPVLGVADSGSIDPADVPPALKWWLDEYARQAAYALSLPEFTVNSVRGTVSPIEEPAAKAVSYAPISPMVETRWDQGSPYNTKCPLYRGTRTVTGCVATAMAQVVKYHNFAAPKGSHTYTTSTNKISVSFDYDSWTPDWSNMLNKVSNSSTTAQKNAVAELMLACGVAVDMDYDTAGSGGSGAASSAIRPGIVNYIGYSSETAYYVRGGLSDAIWGDICYDALEQGYPLIYCGTGTEGGHCFVCDGYSSDGLFHFNWGWSGMSDGYFALSALNPGSLGTGGGAGGFNAAQDIVVAVPDDGRHTYNAPDVPTQEVYGSNMTVSKSTSRVNMKMQVHNGGNTTYTFQLGYRVCDEYGTEVTSKPDATSGWYQLPAGTYYPEVTIGYAISTIANQPDGLYRLFPTYTLQGKGTKVLGVGNGPDCVEITLASGKATKVEAAYAPGDTPTPHPNVKLKSVLPSTMYIGQANTMKVTVVNSGRADMEFSDNLGLALVKSGTNNAVLWLLEADGVIKANESKTYNINDDFDGFETGSYDAYLVTCNDQGGNLAFVDETPQSVTLDKAVLVTGITVSGPSEVEPGNKYSYSASVTPYTATNTKVSWSTDGDSNFYIDQNGYLNMTEQATGTITVTATAMDGSGVSGSMTVTVTEPVPVLVEQITVKGPENVVAGETVSYTAVVTPKDADNTDVVWSVDNDGCTIDNNGVMTVDTDASGSVTVTATAADGSGVKGTLTVGITAGIDATGADNVTVTVANGAVTVAGLVPGTVVTLYDLSGRVVATATAAGQTVTLRPSAGAYLLSAGTVKTAVRL